METNRIRALTNHAAPPDAEHRAAFAAAHANAAAAVHLVVIRVAAAMAVSRAGATACQAGDTAGMLACVDRLGNALDGVAEAVRLALIAAAQEPDAGRP